MQAVDIKTLLENAPFEAFTLHMANGGQFVVDHPELAAFSVNKSSLALALPEGGFAILDLRLTTHSEPLKRRPKKRKS